MNIHMPVELLFWADGISWTTRGRSSMAALRVQVLSPEPCCCPQPLWHQLSDWPLWLLRMHTLSFNTSEAVLVAGMPMTVSQHPRLGIGQASPAKCLLVLQLPPNHPQLQAREGGKQAEVRIYIKYGINV